MSRSIFLLFLLFMKICQSLSAWGCRQARGLGGGHSLGQDLIAKLMGRGILGQPPTCGISRSPSDNPRGEGPATISFPISGTS